MYPDSPTPLDAPLDERGTSRDDAPFDLSIEELDRYPTGVITLARDGTILRYNRAESELSHLPAVEVVGRHFFRDVAPCTAVAAFQGRFEAFASSTISAVERFEWTFAFRWGHQDVSVTLMRRAGRPEIHLVVTVRSRSRSEPSDSGPSVPATTAPSRPHRESSVDGGVGLWNDDPERDIAYRSDGLDRILAAPVGEDAVAPHPILRYVHPEHAAVFADTLADARARSASYVVRTTIVAGDGREKDLLVHGAYLSSGGTDRASRSFGTIVDITQRRRADERLWDSAHIDALTQLPNRRWLLERLIASVAEKEPFVVCFVDLDKFKHVNDTSGHASGDRLLRLVSERVSRALRPSDVVSRIDGDEFVIVFRQAVDVGTIDALVARVLAAIGEPYSIDGRQHHVTASAGIARFPGDGETADALLSAADAAMYRAKSRGPGTFRHFESAFRERVERDDARAKDIFAALDRNEFEPYFQPIVDSRTRAIVGAEALARWEHPTLGTLAPEQFVALAESTGSIHALGSAMLRRACACAKRWFDAYGEAAPFVSVNISAMQFRDRLFDQTVGRILTETGLPPHKLELEFPESLVMNRFDEAVHGLAKLKTLGIRLTVDDFGTGYTALAYLKYLPVDTLKLDRAFVDGVGLESLDESIVRTVVKLASKCHLNVIAEGVERAEQADLLSALDCPQLQGFFFSPPCTAADFDDRLERASVSESSSDVGRPSAS